MHTIVEQNMLLRTRTELPEGLRMAVDEFYEGWDCVRALNASRMQKTILTRGWNFIKIADGALRSGVGDTSQEAIASALRITLRHVSTHFNAVEVEHIELTRYPWFFLARVRVNPYRIQQGSVLMVPDGDQAPPVKPRLKRLPPDHAALYPYFGCAMPELKQMLISCENSQVSAQ